MLFENAIIMAAGRGMRMMPLTNKIPKAMAPINSSTLIAERIKKLKLYFKNVHITVGYKGAMLSKHVIEHDVSSVINTEGHGNSWWIFHSLIKNISDPLFVFTCDNLVDLDFDKYQNDYKYFGYPSCMIIPVKPVIGIEGDFIFHDDYKVHKISRRQISNIYCSGVQIINPKKINDSMGSKNNFLNLWVELINLDDLYVSKNIASNWYSIDNIKNLDIANMMLGKKQL